MKKLGYLIAIAAVLGFSTAKADDVDCQDPKIKTCFTDGDSVSCNCFDPPDNRDDPVVQPPPENENPSEYEPPQ